MKQISYTSIVVFSYNRPNLLKNLIESLKKNKEASSSKIFFFQDNYKNNRDKKDVYKCIKYINSIKGFKKKIIFVRKKNLGFYDNFIKGLKYFFSIEKKGIILEDDLIVSEYFLKFMNQALEKYRNKKKVWSISGWNYNINLNFKHDAYFMRNFMSWSWATWEDRFRRYEKNPEKIIQNWNKKKIKEFNLDNNYDYFSQILRNKNNTLNSFGVFWYATIFENKGLCIAPLKSMVINTGWNSKATHTKIKSKTFTINTLSKMKNFKFPTNVEEDKHLSEKVKKYISGEKKTMIKKIYNRLKSKFLNL